MAILSTYTRRMAYRRFILSSLAQCICCCLLVALPLISIGQGLPLGQWRVHASFSSISQVAFAGSRVYGIAPASILVFDRATQELTTLSKLDGLSEVGASSIAFSQDANTLVIAYPTGTIDLVKDGQVTTLTDIARAQQITDKQINAIYCAGQLAYVCGKFGLVVINLARQEVKASNTTLDPSPQAIPVACFGALEQTDSLYLITSQGVKRIGLNQNLQDSRLYYTWPNTQEFGLPPDASQLASITSEQGRIAIAYKNYGVYILGTNNIWTGVSGISPPCRSLRGTNGLGLLLASDQYVYRIDPITQRVVDTYADINAKAPANAIQDDPSTIWVADFVLGLISIPATQLGQSIRYTPNSPHFNYAFKLYGYKDKMYMLAGGYDGSTFLALARADGYAVYQNNTWKSYLPNDCIPFIRDIVSAVADPTSDTLYLASYVAGVYVEPDQQTCNTGYFYNDTSSRQNTLVNSYPPTPGAQVRITDVALDAQNNLWCLNATTDLALQVKNRYDNKWYAYKPKPDNRAAGVQLMIDANQNKWMRIKPDANTSLAAIIVHGADDTSQGVVNNSQTRGNLPNPNVYDMVQDHDGAVWIGTGAGVGVLYNPDVVLSHQDFAVALPIFDGRPLLENDVVTALAIDGGNRKWMGTRNSGVWLFDKDVSKVLAHFTQDDTPLPSNNVIDIAITPTTGEVFIGTDKGVVSYRADATDALDDPKSNCVSIFPNPVRPGYTGQIGIDCLPANAIVKIVDAGGRLVYETRSNGGTASWSGYDYKGRRAQPGMYLVYAAADGGNGKVVGRFAVIE